MRMLPVAAALLLLLPRGASPQEPVEEWELPQDAVDRVIDFFNDPGTIRFSGRARIPPSSMVVGDVAVLGGPFTVAGTIDGDLVVLNGDLELLEGGRVTGDATVVGGRVMGLEAGAVAGALVVYDAPLRYVHRGDRIGYAGRARRPSEAFSSDLGFGRSRFTVRAGTNYNRVEGLPIMFGPIVETFSRNPTRAELFGVWRTDSGLDVRAEELGYALRLEQRLGGEPGLALGATVASTVEPIERWTLRDVESSLATFILHKDYRDYLERTGWTAYLALRPPTSPFEARLTYRDEDHAFAPVGGPWSLKDNDRPWRPQPLVAEGRLRSLEAGLTLDTRNDPQRPSDGWWVQATARRGVGGSLVIREHLDAVTAGADVVPARAVDTGFTSGLLDVRRYARLGPGAEVGLRGLLGGSLDGGGLPPQFQHALGGEGSLPGYRLFHGDCGARRTRVALPGSGEGGAPTPVFASYGCDRFAVLQFEYRGQLDIDLSLPPGSGSEWDEGWDWFPVIDLNPRWTAFVDVGRGWVAGAHDAGGFPRSGTGTLADAGVGIYLGELGVFWAVPLRGGGGVNFFVRLSRRF